MIAWLLGLHAVATLAMTGVAWMVQLVHYPLFAHVDRERFADFEREHQRRIGPLVAPLMLVEAGTALALVLLRPSQLWWPATLAGLALVAVVWVSTWLLQVPQHAVLASGWDERAHARLISTSWLRTIAWSLRGLLAAAFALA